MMSKSLFRLKISIIFRMCGKNSYVSLDHWNTIDIGKMGKDWNMVEFKLNRIRQYAPLVCTTRLQYFDQKEKNIKILSY